MGFSSRDGVAESWRRALDPRCYRRNVATAKHACLVLLALSAACDGLPGGGSPDAPAPDAPPAEACDAITWAAPAGCTATDVEGKLRCIPGMQVTPRPDLAPAGYQRFDLVFPQPVDHTDPSSPMFTQRAVLLHISDAAPVVMSTSGYGLSTGRSEPTRLFSANQLSYEHRYFAASRPVPADWSKLDIQQAADDAHRLAEAIHWMYPGKWLNTGGSKGGMTSTYHRRLHPCDVDATIAYVAPTSLGPADPAYVTFLDNVGGADFAACRADLAAFQRRLLDQRDELLPLVQGTFTQISVDKAYEMAVIELNFAFWQYTFPDDPAVGCATIPGPDASPPQMLDFLDTHVGVAALADDDVLDFYHGYYHQAAAQLGAPAPYETPVADLLQFPGLDVAISFIPAGEVTTFDTAAMPDVNQWVATSGRQMMFIYGEFDPWSSRMFEPSALDSHRFIVPGGNHGSSISQLSDEDRAAAIARLTQWLGSPAIAPLTRRTAPATVRSVDRDDRRELRPPR